MKSIVDRLSASLNSVRRLLLAFGMVLAAVTVLVTALRSKIEELGSLPSLLVWLGIVIIALALAIWLTVSAQRRSVLRRPERFVFCTDDPKQCVGREAATAHILAACEQHPLVWLVGESGVGKSTVVRELVRVCPSRQEVNGVQRLLAIRLDSSSLPWGNGLKAALSRALMSMPMEERRLLGDGGTEEPLEPFGWLARLSSNAHRRLLIIVDQFDDYAFRHRDEFFHEMTSVTPAELDASGTEWAELAHGLRNDHFHLLLVCRSDAMLALRAVEFVTATPRSLPRIDPEWLDRALEELTHDEGIGPVVEAPERGWLQLKGRLLRDLSADTGRILPVQWVVCLESLHRLKFLTPREYLSKGGVRGLERLHVERHVEDAAIESGATKGAVLAGLALLLSEDGCKTQYLTRAEFEQTVVLGREETPALNRLIDYLERWHIIRRQYVNGSEYILLHHDYLARGIREACRQANYWPQLLREHARDFSEALEWSQYWRALLPLYAQIGMAWEWLRGRLRYGEHARFATFSLLRAIPPVMAGIALVTLGHWVGQLRMQTRVEHFFTLCQVKLSAFESLRRPYVPAYWYPADETDNAGRALMDGGPEMALEAIRRGLEQPVLTHALQTCSELLVHAAVGLDPTGGLSEHLFRSVLLPTLKKGHFGATGVATDLIASVKLSPADVEDLVDYESREMTKWANFVPGTSLLTHLAPLMTAAERQAISSQLLDLLGRDLHTLESKDTQVSAAATERFKVLIALVGELNRDSSTDRKADFAKVEAQSISRRAGGWNLMALSEEFAQVDLKDHPEAMKVAVDSLIDLLNVPRQSFERQFLWRALGRIRPMGDSDCTHRILDEILRRIEAETDPGTLMEMVGAFLSTDTDAASVHVVVRGLLQHILEYSDANSIRTVGAMLSRLSPRLSEVDRQEAADAMLQRALIEHDRKLALAFWQALVALAPRLRPSESHSATTDLLSHVIHGEKDAPTFNDYCGVMTALSLQLETSALSDAAATLLRDGTAARDVSSSIESSHALQCLGPKSGTVVPATVDHPSLHAAADATLEQLAGEKDERTVAFALEMLASISSRLTVDVRHRIAIIIAKRMPVAPSSIERNAYNLAVKKLSGWLEADDRRLLSSALYQCLLSESEGYILVELIDALSMLDQPPHLYDLTKIQASLAHHIETEQGDTALCDLVRASAKLELHGYGRSAHPAVLALATRVLRFDHNFDLEHSTKALRCLPPDVRAEDVRPVVEMLAERIRVTQDWHVLEGLTSAWCMLERIADTGVSTDERIQRYVELLSLPLMVGQQQKTLLQGLEGVTGAQFGGDLWRFVAWREASGRAPPKSYFALFAGVR